MNGTKRRGTELPWKVLGRPVKPVALGMTVIMVGLAVYNALGLGSFGPGSVATAFAVLAAVGTVLLVVGWVGRQQRAAEWGLLVSSWVLATRTVFIVLTDGWQELGVVLSTGAAIIAGGAYLLERADDSRGR